MFGDFMQNFGLQFPFQGTDPAGGLFGQNTPTAPGQAPLGGAAQPSGGGAKQDAPGTVPQPPAAGVQGQQPLTPQSPLAPQQTSPGETSGQETPAAGVGNQFGKTGT